ncbi:MAG: NADH-quinone oxidoreductase subunit NuoK [Vampirovibrionales bacterium]|nr:NADH-quinone oxidoreductase subunit NuoK [Vampirovibrionales bacterium]
MTLTHYLALAATLFAIGLAGLLTSRNAIRALMSLELMLNSVNINLVALNNFLAPQLNGAALLNGHVFAIFILTVSAAEAAVGLALILALFRQRKTVDMDAFTTLKG